MVIGQTDTTGTDRPGSERKRQTSTIVAGLLIALVLGAIGWSLVDTGSTDGEVAALVRDYITAWDAGDGEAVMTLMAADGVHTCPRGTFAVAEDGGAGLIAVVESMRNDVFEIVGGPIATRTEAPLDAVAFVRIDATGAEVVGLASYRIVEEGGALRIAESTYTHL